MSDKFEERARELVRDVCDKDDRCLPQESCSCRDAIAQALRDAERGRTEPLDPLKDWDRARHGADFGPPPAADADKVDGVGRLLEAYLKAREAGHPLTATAKRWLVEAVDDLS